MHINEINQKNYKSYGNINETIKFKKDKGELILISGPNGEGKSSILEIFELAIYGEVLNKEGKRLTQKNLPNRRNGNLYANIDFDVDANYKIQRKMETSTSSIKTELLIDDIPYKKANKIQDKINEKVIFDLKSFKSFISLNINIFKNFMSLTPEEKRILLDKLFNLEIINDLNKILKQLKTNNDNSFSSLKREMDIYKNNIDNLKTTINNFITKNKNDKEEKIKSLKEVLNNNKENFILLENNKNDIQQTVEQNTEFIYELNNKISLYNKDISYINEKINLFKKGICPTCETKLIGELNLLPEFEERLKLTTELKLKLQQEYTSLNNDLNEKRLELKKINNDYNELLNYLSNIKTEIKLLKEVKEEDNVDEFKINLQQQEIKLEEKNKENKDIQKLKYIYDLLIPIQSENGIKRDIIESIIGPINEFIYEDILQLKSQYRIELDNNFDAHVTEFGQEIDPDSLSTGEAKKLNLIILLAYIKTLRLRRNINILILDEVFASIDIESVNDILILFKKFANERNLNIIVVHHTELNHANFDRVIAVKKSGFSYIEDIQLT